MRGWLNPVRDWSALDKESRRDLRIALLLACVGVLLYLPGIGWGLPEATGPLLVRGWGADELGPFGPIAEVRNTFTHAEIGNPQYPLFHYFVCFVFDAPYLIFLILTRQLVHPSAIYPFGLSHPETAVKVLLVIARVVSVLMGAGVGVVGYFTAKRLWNRTAGVVAGFLVLLIYTMFYYARTSNVDVPALFWASIGLYLFVRVMQDGLTLPRAVWLGAIAALAVATKDQNYGVFLLLPLAIMLDHFRRLHAAGRTDFASRCQAALAGLAVAAAVYGVASGFLFYPEKFFAHLAFIRAGAPHYRSYFEYPATLQGYWGLALRASGYILESLNWPILLAALAGILLFLRQKRYVLTLLLPFPAFFLTVLLPVRYVELRYVMVLAYILALLAACAFAAGFGSTRRAVRTLTGVLLVAGVGWLLLRDADLTYVMLRDSRYVATAWFAEHMKTPGQVEYFGDGTDRGERRIAGLPRMPKGSYLEIAKVGFPPGSGSPAAEFVLIQGRADMEKHWYCPPWALQRLQDGSFGYRRVAVLQTKGLFSHPGLSLNPVVNPRIEIFQRISPAPAASTDEMGGH